jgi:hypothetical protein
MTNHPNRNRTFWLVRPADRIIDRAHSRIGGCEMMVAHSYTDADKDLALKELAAAQDWLRRACEAKRAWYAVEHGDYEEYPDVPETV